MKPRPHRAALVAAFSAALLAVTALPAAALVLNTDADSDTTAIIELDDCVLFIDVDTTTNVTLELTLPSTTLVVNVTGHATVGPLDLGGLLDVCIDICLEAHVGADAEAAVGVTLPVVLPVVVAASGNVLVTAQVTNCPPVETPIPDFPAPYAATAAAAGGLGLYGLLRRRQA